MAGDHSAEGTRHEPGCEPIPSETWLDLTTALRLWADALQARWRDSSFRLYGSWSYRSGTLSVTTSTEGSHTKTPRCGHPVRGATGVSVKVDHQDDPRVPTLADAMLELPLRAFGGPAPSPTEKAVSDAREKVAAVVTKHPQLRRAIMRATWGPKAAETSDDREEAGRSGDTSTGLIAISGVFERVLARRGLSVANLSSATVADEWITETVDLLSESLGTQFHQQELVAVLNCPAIDTGGPIRLWESSWHGAPCWIEIGYPSDSLCAAVLHHLGYKYVPADSNLDHMNCFVRFRFAIPTGFNSDDWAATNWSAEGYLREIVDLLRVAFDGDIGILHISGRSLERADPDLTPHFLGSFQEGPGYLPRTPLRRIYDPPTVHCANETELEVVGSLFQRYSIERIQVPGLPVAMDRLRGIFERYEPGEPGRLVDAVTGLEALFLSEGLISELKYRLQVRIARFLEADLQKRVSLAKRFSKLYDLRSKLVHTGTKGSAKETEAQESQRLAVELLRCALREFILTDFAKGKAAKEMEDVWLKFMLSDGPQAAD